MEEQAVSPASATIASIPNATFHIFTFINLSIPYSFQKYMIFSDELQGSGEQGSGTFSLFFNLYTTSHPEQVIPLEERESASNYDFIVKTYHYREQAFNAPGKSMRDSHPRKWGFSLLILRIL
jgi:hypothetical protein